MASSVEILTYLGLILTRSNGKYLKDIPTNEKAYSKTISIGGNARVRAQIPCVAPYIEIGISEFEEFKSFTTFTNIQKMILYITSPFFWIKIKSK